MARVRAIGHEDRLTLVEHLDELRSRLIVSAAALLVAVGLCFWQNHLILDLLNAPLPGNQEPVTFGVSEPFMTTLTVSAYAGILLALPVILYEAYAFALPALSPGQRRVALPLMLMVPVLFVAGVVFSYAVVLPGALKFLVNFNSDQFHIQIRAREYYGFVVMTLGAMGLLFQIPVGVLAATKLGLTTPHKMRRARRHAIVGIAVIAMLLPGTDPVTMLISMAPMVVLYELSIILASVAGKPVHARDVAEAGQAG